MGKLVGIIFLISVLVIVAGFIVFLSISHPERRLDVGANIEEIQIKDNLAYVTLSGGANDKEIDRVKFIFTDSKGVQHYYFTTEGIENLSKPYKKSIINLFKEPEFEGTYKYTIDSNEIGFENFDSIYKVEVVFDYEKEALEIDKEVSLDSEVINEESAPSGGGGSSGGGGGGSSFTPESDLIPTPKAYWMYGGNEVVSLDDMEYETTLRLVFENSGISSGTNVEFTIYERDWLGDDYMAKVNTLVGSNGYVSVDWVIEEAHVDAARNLLEGNKIELYFEIRGIKSGILKIGFEDTGIEPNCFDDIQNQNETGVDCGGECGACEASTGLVAHYAFENNLADTTGSNNPGNMFGGSYSSGVLGQGLQLGGSEYALVSAQDLSTNSGSVALWVMPSTIVSGRSYALTHRIEGENNRIYLKTLDGEFSPGFGNTLDISTGQSVPVGAWSHMAITWVGANYNAYLDGVLAASGTTSTLTSVVPSLTIGCYINGEECFIGIIDEMKVWDYALSAQEISSEFFSVTPVTFQPNCSDEIQNQNETGIDCGGECAACESGVPSDSMTCNNPLRSIDFETGDFSQISVGGDLVGNYALVSDQTHSGNYAVRFISGSGYPSKSDIRLWGAERSIGTTSSPDRWDSFWIYVPSDFDSSPWNMLIEWCPRITDSHNLGWRFCDRHVLVGFEDRNNVEANVYLYFGNSLDYGFFPDNPGANYRGIYSGVSMPKGEWVHFNMHTYWSLNSNGKVEIWMNNQKVIDYTGRTILSEDYPDVGHNSEIGSYRYGSLPASPMYVDDVLICSDEIVGEIVVANCDDGNSCTTDSSMEGVCSYTPYCSSTDGVCCLGCTPAQDDDCVVSSTYIIADHTSVDAFDNIPSCWIDQVKQMFFLYPGESHGNGILVGSQSLENQDSTYAYGSGSNEFEISRSLPSSGCGSWCGEEDIWTNSNAIQEVISSITNYENQGEKPDAFSFGWCWDMTQGDGPSSDDPIYNVGWAGRSSGSPSGSGRWGLDDGDYSLTSNDVSMQTYLDALQTIQTAHSDVAVIYSTGPVEGWSNQGELGYQRYIKHERIREYVQNNNLYLFDYADILTHNSAGQQNTLSWNGNSFPFIHGDNAETGWSDTHIGYQGELRIAKANWWMMARIAGWDGVSSGC